MLEAQLLSKILDEDKFAELRRYNVTASDFPTLAPVYEFIEDCVKESGGHVPDYRTVAAKFKEFDYYPEVADGFLYLCSRLKQRTAKRQAFELLQKDAGEQFKKLDGVAFAEWLRAETERILRQTQTRNDLGYNYATGGDERKAWYADSKDNRSLQFIPTPYKTLTKALGGGFEIGDDILLLAWTNVGKTWMASDIGRVAHEAGFGVLQYAPELNRRQQALRIDTLKGHFDNVKLRRGNLAEADEREYLDKFLGAFNDKVQVPYIIKTMEDLPDGLSTDVIENDIAMYENVQLVIVDGFNLMDHGRRADRNSMTQTSRQLRQVFGGKRTGRPVAGVVVHHTTASSQKGKVDEDKTRVVDPPKLTDFSETIALIQDAATVLTFDQYQGIGKLAVEKAREPSVGTVIELACNFNLGYIKEQDATRHF